MTRSARRATVATMILVLVILAAPVAQAKKNYPPRTPSCSVSPMQISSAGQAVSLVGKNWKPSSTVNIYFSKTTPSPSSPGQLIATGFPDSNGNFSTSGSTPPTTGRKAYIDFVGPGSPTNSSPSVQCIVTLKVVNPVSVRKPISITGSALVGLGVLGLFLLLSVAHRRRARALRA